MKKLIFILISSLLLATNGYSQITSNRPATGRKAVWDYPVKPGSKEWAKFKTVEEEYAAYNIPADIIKEISTEELVKTCLAYPEWGLIYAFNDPQTGFSHVLNLFNGFGELFSRKDAAKELLKVYAGMNPLNAGRLRTDLEKGMFGFKFTCIEMLMSAQPVILRMDEADKRLMLREGVAKYRHKEQLPEIYSLWTLSPSAQLCLAVLESEGQITGDEARKSLKRRALHHDKAVLDGVINESEKFLKP